MKLGLPVLAIFILGFFFWSFSAVADEKLSVTAQTIEELEQLRPVLVFEPDNVTTYTGIIDPAERARANADFARLIDRLGAELPQRSDRSFVEQEIEKTYSSFRLADTEDRERAIGYFARILKVVGAKDYDRFLNILLYGPILGEMVSK